MKKQTIKLCCTLVGAVSLMNTTSLFADIIIGTGNITENGPENTGPYSVTTTSTTGAALGTFETFCLNYAVNANLGSTYSYQMGTVIHPNAGDGYVTPNYSYVTLGTAWLYSQFRDNAFGLQTAPNEGLALAIWYLQHDAHGTDTGTAAGTSGYYINLADAAVGAGNVATDANGMYGVYAMSLTTGAADTAGFAQPQLAIVPEPTTFLAGGLLLLPFAISGVRMIRRNRMA